MDLEFKVITLNCWGIPFVSKDRVDRMKAIAEFLATSQYDVVCLQEVWTDSDFILIKEKAAGNLPYAHYFYSGVVGSGVCILSKHPMEEVFFHQWAVNGYMHKLHHGDWFGGKGVGLCRLKVNGYSINVYSAHLHAEYNRECDEYQAHRVLQAFDTAQFIQLTSAGADLVVLAGDLNTEPGDLAYRIILGVPALQDSFVISGQKLPDSTTNECLENSYTSSSQIKEKTPGKRIDYILYHAGSKVQVELKKYTAPLPKRVPNRDYSYSDHEAIAATLFVKKSVKKPREYDQELKKTVLNESIVICSNAIKRLNNHQLVYGILSILTVFVLIGSLFLHIPYQYSVLVYIIKFLLTVFLIYTIFMATIWNQMEKHGVLAGKLAMEVCLNSLKSNLKF